MKAPRQNRGWLSIAVIAIAISLLLVMALHAQRADHVDFIAILPLLFVGVISPLSLLSPLASVYLGRTSDAPALPSSFQRPPPFRFA